MLCKNHSTPTVSLDFYTTISIPLSCLFKFLHNSSLEPTGSRELLFPQYHFSRLIAIQLVIKEKPFFKMSLVIIFITHDFSLLLFECLPRRRGRASSLYYRDECWAGLTSKSFCSRGDSSVKCLCHITLPILILGNVEL